MIGMKELKEVLPARFLEEAEAERRSEQAERRAELAAEIEELTERAKTELPPLAEAAEAASARVAELKEELERAKGVSMRRSQAVMTRSSSFQRGIESRRRRLESGVLAWPEIVEARERLQDLHEETRRTLASQHYETAVDGQNVMVATNRPQIRARLDGIVNALRTDGPLARAARIPDRDACVEAIEAIFQELPEVGKPEPV